MQKTVSSNPMEKTNRPTSICCAKNPSCNSDKDDKGGGLCLEDHISGLPDVVLVSILSLLTMKEAGRTCLLSKRWSYLSQLESLTLQISNMMEHTFEEPDLEDTKFPVLNKLKRLELIVGATDDESLTVFVPLIEACPFLATFVFQLQWCKPFRKRKHERFTSRPHEYLKVVEFIGFVGRTNDVELAMYLIRSAVNLQKITFDPRIPLLVGTPWEFMETKRKTAARKRAKKLGTKLPVGAALVIL
ncbi:uncharacterized protein LOC132303434 isoform X2 [Cornus florida]|uniref:uncharacterized protein LOC132303434 isoform X2 n=1 Tax=Cornus florida TaxID=4283 RepID=UPI00289784B4|nr:uncharacterized protein LOC132303434 isoform X2 [Cornus florida]